MKIYCSNVPEYDTRFDDFIGTDLWVKVEFPDKKGSFGTQDAYINIESRDGDMITYRIVTAQNVTDMARNRYEGLGNISYLRQLNTVRTLPYDRLQFLFVEPLDVISTDELYDAMTVGR